MGTIHACKSEQWQLDGEENQVPIGYVGLGAMGRELAARLINQHDLLVYDLDNEAIVRLEKEGATGAASLAAMGEQCDVVVLCLPKSGNVERALFDERGLASTLKPGSVVIDQTSGQPGQTRSFAERLAARGIAMVDAPVSGGVPLARAGSVTIMASGPDEDFAKARPILDAISSNVFHCGGPVGSGQALKAINNTVNSANRLATLEVAAIGRRLGLSLADMTEAFNSGPAKNFISEKMLVAMCEGKASTDFALALMVKDLDQGFDLAASHAASMPVCEAARAMLCAALKLTGEDARLEDVIPFMERLTGTSYVGETASRADEVGLSSRAAMALVSAALAACTRMAFAENLALAEKLGMEAERMAPAILSGSARSASAERLLAGENDPLVTDDMVESLSRLARIGSRFGIPMLMTNQVRSHCLALQ